MGIGGFTDEDSEKTGKGDEGTSLKGIFVLALGNLR